MPAPRKVLLADPDPATARALGPALRRRGYRLYVAHDGSRALELAVLRTPDVVLLDERAAMVDARTFVSILRTNPRTEAIPVLLAGDGESPEAARLGSYLRKPLHPDEVLARIEQVLASARTAAAGSGVQGSLAELPLADLLQILSVNRKTGRLELSRAGARAEVALAEGRVEDASAGAARGEKALFRLLSWPDGQFAFAPGKPAGARRIHRRLDELVLEAARQSDEASRLRPSLPPAGERLGLSRGVGGGLDPVAAEVLSALAHPRTVEEVLDVCSASDVDALGALARLLERGHVRREARRPEAAEARPALPSQELRALRRRIERAAGRSGASVGKVILAGGGPLARRSALVRLAGLPGFCALADGLPVAFGTLGRLTLGEGASVDLVALPSDPAMAPLWRPFAAGAIAALLLLPAEGVAPRLADLCREPRLAMGACGPAHEGLDPALEAAGCAFLGCDPGEALRALLALAASTDA